MMKRLRLLMVALTVHLLFMDGSAYGQVCTVNGFIDEATMKDGLLQMLADFSAYMKQDFLPCDESNSRGEACGCFRSGSTMRSNEDGVRTNADLGMVCAFLCYYAKGKVVLPAGVGWDDLECMARQSLVYAYSTHKANRLMTTADGRYWGSMSQRDHVWESSLWAMSVAYSAFFQWQQLDDEQRLCIYRLLKAECNYELERDVPTGFEGDTKAEENGWEADVLAATLGLFPDDELAPQWFDRLRLFAVNSYSHPADAADETIVDPGRDTVKVKDLYRGANLYDDYTLQNHNYFHTSYQNVVIQELGEAALALRLFQGTAARWQTNALMHNNQRVMDNVLKWLALSDGELAMPNGNDWSLFLYDQITSYAVMACMLGDVDALLLENRAYRMIRARQQTTGDGSWLLRSDIGARRMGVQAHRVMMTWLMHEFFPTANLHPSSWEAFRQRHSAARIFSSQNIIRASTKDRFTCFSWSRGQKSYTGYIAPHQDTDFKPEAANIIVPYKAHNTGNLLGWYDVKGRRTNAVPVVDGICQIGGDGWTMNGQLLCNDSALDHRFAIFSTPGNAFIYMDDVRALEDVDIFGERGGAIAVNTDESTKIVRRLYDENVDNILGIVARPRGMMVFGERKNFNSVMTTPLYAFYSDSVRTIRKGDVVGRRQMVCYSNVDTTATKRLSAFVAEMDAPEGWGALVATDPDGTCYVLICNFCGAERGRVSGWVPAFDRRLQTIVTLGRNRSLAGRVIKENGRLRVSPM